MILKRIQNKGSGSGQFLGVIAAVFSLVSLVASAESSSDCIGLFSEDGVRAGPRFRVPMPPAEKATEVRTLRVMTWNLQDAFIPSELLHQVPAAIDRQRFMKRKPSQSLQSIAQSIAAARPDVAVFQEVSHQRVLRYLSDHDLRGEYHAVLVRANDERGFEIGFLIRKGLPFQVHFESHQKMIRVNESQELPLFSRDAPTLEFRRLGEPESAAPAFIVMGVHQKSKRPRDGDPDGSHLRAEQVNGVLSILEDYNVRYQKGIPAIVAGDFNADLKRGASPELSPLFQKLTDVFDLLKTPLPVQSRVTQFYFTEKNKPDFRQLDGILVTPEFSNAVSSATVIPFTNAAGQALPNPRSFAERRQYPSDHRPIFTEIQLPKSN